MYPETIVGRMDHNQWLLREDLEIVVVATTDPEAVETTDHPADPQEVQVVEEIAVHRLDRSN